MRRRPAPALENASPMNRRRGQRRLAIAGERRRTSRSYAGVSERAGSTGGVGEPIALMCRAATSPASRSRLSKSMSAD